MPDPGLLLRRAALRTDPVLRPLWQLGYELLIRAVAAWARRAVGGATVYAAGSVAAGRPLSGVSDIDLAVVVPDSGRDGLERRWRERTARSPRLGRLMFLAVYGETDLAAATAADCLTHPDAVLLGERPVRDLMSLLVRPGLEPPASSWRRISGPERRAAPARVDERIAGWLELQQWWRNVFEVAAQPPGLGRPYLCLRLVSEPARIWLLLAHGERPGTRRAVLESARRRLPEEEVTLTAALDLLGRLSRRPPVDLADVLPFLVRQSQRIARAIEGPTVPVALAGRVDGGLPLLDFRGIVAPTRPDERLVLADGDPADPATLAAAQGALRADGLLVLPAERWAPTILRSVQCPVTDPVSFALLGGATTAAFTDAPGWSPRGWANRAVAEHRAWLGAADPLPDTLWAGEQPSSRTASAEGLGWLFAAARAGLFHKTVEVGAPELALTLEEVAARLGPPAPDALAAYREGASDQALFDAFGASVRTLSAYR